MVELDFQEKEGGASTSGAARFRTGAARFRTGAARFRTGAARFRKMYLCEEYLPLQKRPPNNI